MKCLLIAATLVVPSVAFADKPLPISAHTPPLIFDEASVSLEVVGKGSDGYGWHSHVELKGVASKNDRLRLEWKAGGKLIYTAKCDVSIEDGYMSGSCNNQGTSEKPLKQVGEITAELIYEDDSNDKEYLVRTMKIQVVHLKGQWETWGNVADDTLGSAFLWMGNDEATNSTYRMPNLYLTFANGQQPNDATLRCTAEGKKIKDISLGAESGADTEDIELDYQPKKGERQTHHWNRQKFLVNIYWGKRETLKWEMPAKTEKDLVLSDNPGKWECNLRTEGKVVRTLSFVVNKDGMIQNDEFNTGKGAIPMLSDREVMLDMRMTKDSSFIDKRINPAAMKKSLQYGLPWPDHPKVKQIQASFPAKSGLPDPK
ncbi:MAG: hypothetical protein IPQ07_28930 [Myxococcales bacterium]|nr:hypothetical protein [Myxococcales bacterium]